MTPPMKCLHSFFSVVCQQRRLNNKKWIKRNMNFVKHCLRLTILKTKLLKTHKNEGRRNIESLNRFKTYGRNDSWKLKYWARRLNRFKFLVWTPTRFNLRFQKLNRFKNVHHHYFVSRLPLKKWQVSNVVFLVKNKSLLLINSRGAAVKRKIAKRRVKHRE